MLFVFIQMAIADPISESLAKLRELRGWEQRELAAAIGVTQGYVSKLIAGKHRPSGLIRLKISALLRETPGVEGAVPIEDLMQRVAAAAESSEAFRQLIALSLSIFENIPK